MMNLNDRIPKLSNLDSIWWYSHRIRITYVSPGWLIVWDHQDNPPTRYDCREPKHPEACNAAEQKVRELTTKAVN